MSPRSDIELIDDLLEAADRIAQIVSLGRERYDVDAILSAAAERQLEKIGEAARLLSPEFVDTHPDLPIRKAVGQRHFIAHEYWKIDYDELWDTMTLDVPPFAEALRAIRSR